MKFSHTSFALIFICVLFFSSKTAYSAHLAGGYITYECQGKNSDRTYTYDITVHVFKDCSGTPQFPEWNTPFDKRIRISFFDRESGRLSPYSTDFFLGDSTTQFFQSKDTCPSFFGSYCYSKAEYKASVKLPESEKGYDVVWARCCRPPSIKNILDPHDMGYVLRAILPENSFCNNSPVITKEFPPAIYKEESFSFNFNVIDIDGDSLAYEVVTPNHGGDRSNPIPGPMAPPYPFVNFHPDYSKESPFGKTSTFNLDPQTGQLNITPMEEGVYVFAILIKEYRDGELINEIPRDVLIQVIPNISPKECPDITIEDVIVDLNIYPNPFRGRTNIDFHLTLPGRLKIELFDSQGKFINAIIDEEVSRGQFNIKWNPAYFPFDLAPLIDHIECGVYYLRISLEEYVVVKKVVFTN